MVKFRKGDIVSLEGEVKFDFHGAADDRLFLEIEHSTASVNPYHVALVHPFLKEGETVRHVCGNCGVVIAVKDRMVWVRDKLGHNHVWHTDSVALVTDDDRSESDAVAESTTVIEIVGASA